METPSGGEGVPGVNPAGLAEELAKIRGSSETIRAPTGLSLPLPGNRDSRNQFNLAKARADAAAAAAATVGAASSLSSTYRSRRQSGSSQISLNSKTSYRSGSQRRARRTKKGDLTAGENIQVFDESGKEVTPKPLVQLKPSVLYDKLSQATAGRVSPTNVEADLSAPPFSRTGYSITSSAGSLTPETVEGEDVDRDDGTMSVKSRSLLGTSIGIPEMPKIIQVVMAQVAPPTTQKEKEEIIYVFLHESESFILLNFRGANFNAAFEGLTTATERNDRYTKLLELKQGSDNYSHAYAQTLVGLLKNKEVQVWAPSMQSKPCQANSWDIQDTISGQKQQDLRDPWAMAQAKKAAELAAQDAAQVPTSLPKLYGLMEGPNAPSPITSPQPSRRPSSTQGGAQFSRRGSVSGQYSRRQSISGKMSRRGSVSGGAMSRRMSATASIQVEELFGKRPGAVDSSMGDGALASDGLQSGRTHVFDGDTSKLTNLFKSLQVAERSLVQNTYHEKLLAYKDYRLRDPEQPPPKPPPMVTIEQQHVPKKDQLPAPAPAPVPVPTPEPEEAPQPPPSPTEISDQKLHWLWDYKCDFTTDKNVSCMCWNKVNKDLLCVGYGQFDFGTQKGGLVAFWSIKNPGYPLATIACKSDVTAIDFSTSTPTLLAVGFYNGILAIYDTRNPKDASPIVQSGMNSGRHGDPIWKVQWIDSTSEHGESLVSISTDGRVSQWFLKKDLEFVDLIKLKRVSGSSKGEQAQPFISRRAAGMCFDFCPRDPGVYLVGSEEGRVYKCDRSYSEQYMMTYVGHTGPVYQVHWNRFVPNFFLTCSSDWTVRFWREEQESALMVIQTVNQPISDVQWSNKNSTVFSTVAADGRLEIWDMGISVMKPTVIHSVEGSKLSCLMFGDEVPVVLTGGSNGVVSVLRLDGFEKIDTDAKQQKIFKEALALNINAHL